MPEFRPLPANTPMLSVTTFSGEDGKKGNVSEGSGSPCFQRTALRQRPSAQAKLSSETAHVDLEARLQKDNPTYAPTKIILLHL